MQRKREHVRLPVPDEEKIPLGAEEGPGLRLRRNSFFASRRRHTSSVSAFLLNRSSDLLYGNLPPREISMKDVFRSGDSSKKFKIAEGQWYRYAPSYVSPAYHLLEGFPFIQEPPSGDLQERVLIRHH